MEEVKFNSRLDDDDDDSTDTDLDEIEGEALSRKKSGVAIREKPGLKKKVSLRKLKEQKASISGNKGLFQYDLTGQLEKMIQKAGGPKKEVQPPNPRRELEKERLRVISARILPGVSKRFEGKWQSEETSFDTFLDELNVGMSFRKLAAKFGGTQMQKLYIKQDGEYFEVVETNDRRDIYMAFRTNETFSSVSERGEALECIAHWEDNAQKDELIIESKNIETGEINLVRRRISEDGAQLVETKEDGHGKVLKTRTYERVPSSK